MLGEWKRIGVDTRVGCPVEKYSSNDCDGGDKSFLWVSTIAVERHSFFRFPTVVFVFLVKNNDFVWFERSSCSRTKFQYKRANIRTQLVKGAYLLSRRLKFVFRFGAKFMFWLLLNSADKRFRQRAVSVRHWSHPVYWPIGCTRLNDLAAANVRQTRNRRKQCVLLGKFLRGFTPIVGIGRRWRRNKCHRQRKTRQTVTIRNIFICYYVAARVRVCISFRQIVASVHRAQCPAVLITNSVFKQSCSYVANANFLYTYLHTFTNDDIAINARLRLYYCCVRFVLIIIVLYIVNPPDVYDRACRRAHNIPYP